MRASAASLQGLGAPSVSSRTLTPGLKRGLEARVKLLDLRRPAAPRWPCSRGGRAEGGWGGFVLPAFAAVGVAVALADAPGVSARCQSTEPEGAVEPQPPPPPPPPPAESELEASPSPSPHWERLDTILAVTYPGFMQSHLLHETLAGPGKVS
jgi:hypothetical protein